MTGARRPRSRVSARVRRELSPHVPIDSVYGDSDVVTVVYPTPADPLDADVHGEYVSALGSVMVELERGRYQAPALLRGVCHADAYEVPVVWLARREWAAAYNAGDIDAEEYIPRITNESSGIDTWVADTDSTDSSLDTSHGH
jgi:hypothetical protein